MSFSSREVEGGNHGGQAPSPRPPPGADLCPPRVGEGTRLPQETRSPSIWADGGVLGFGGRPSFSIFNEPGDSSSLSSNLLRLSPALRGSRRTFRASRPPRRA